MFRLHGLAIFLDPRFKNQIVDDKEQFGRKVEAWICEELKDLKDLDTVFEPVNKLPHKHVNLSNSIFGLHASLISNQQAPQLAENTMITHELLKYKSEACVPLSLSPVDFWKVN